MKSLKLRRELRRLSTSKRETIHLRNLAERIGNIPQRGLNQSAKSRIADELDISKPVYVARYAIAAGFAALFLLTIGVQLSKPGSTLYALKRRGEDIRALVQPSFKAEIQKEREVQNHDANDDSKSQQTEDKNEHSGTSEDTNKSSSVEGESTPKQSDRAPDTKSSTPSGSDGHGSGSSSSDDSSE